MASKQVAAESYAIGDLVQLKSGGPEMTVSGIPNEIHREHVRCEWFAGKKLEHANFHVGTLNRVPPKKAT